jgi:hypothetical protein
LTLHSHQWAMVPVSPKTAIVFPSNPDVDAAGTVQFRLSGANLPNIVPLTLLWKVYPIQQDSYYTTFFHARSDGTFDGDATYFGCHPYPNPAPNGTAHNWEISIATLDITTDENSNDTTVAPGQWYSQAASTRSDGVSSTIVDFYWNLSVSSNRIISYTTALGVALANASVSPAITFGDAPWAPGQECLSGRLRGIQIYSSRLLLTDIEALNVCETDAQVLAACSERGITSLWFLNMNPTPSDITDKSGNGRNPSWANANRPTLWSS